MAHPPLSKVVDRAIAQDTRRFRKLLVAIYADADAAEAVFSERADAVGALKAGREMAAQPGSFGEVRAPGGEALAALAREAGFAGGMAHLLQRERDPAALAALMNERFFQGACTVFEDPARMHQRWREAVQAEGISAAADRLVANPEGFGELRPNATGFLRTLSARGVDAEVARAHAAAHQRERATGPTREHAPLPRTRAELERVAGGHLPGPLAIKLEALASDYRRLLADAYADPQRAERVFHEITGREGIQAAVMAVRRQPRVLGELTPAPDAADSAYAAVKRAARAYELNSIADPTEAAAVLQRETARSIARRCANPAEALQVVEAAMRRDGVERIYDEIRRDPSRFFTPLEGQVLDPGELASEVRALGHANQRADELMQAHARARNPERAPHLAATDAAAAALQTHVDAAQLADRKNGLHGVLNDAANALRRAEDADKWHDIYRNQFRRSLARIYSNPAEAEAAFLALADEKGLAAAIDRLTKKPHRLGALGRDKRSAREAAASAGPTAFAFLTAREALSTVEWRDREGHVHRGVANVRAATTAELKTSSADLAQTDTRLREIGGVEGTRRRAIEAVQGITSEQADQIIAALQARNSEAARPLAAVREAAANRREGMLPPGAHYAALQTAQLVRSMGEGPTL